MSNMKAIKKRISILQMEINKKVLEYESLSNDEICQISKRLDRAINQWNREFSKSS